MFGLADLKRFYCISYRVYCNRFAIVREQISLRTTAADKYHKEPSVKTCQANNIPNMVTSKFAS